MSKVTHDGDGKLYYHNKKGELKWLAEVQYYEGDMMAKAINKYCEEMFGEKTPEKPKEKELILSEKEIAYNLRKKIHKENLDLLNDYELNILSTLDKLLEWQEEYDHVKWSEFRDEWIKCDRCQGYEQGGQCICYAR